MNSKPHGNWLIYYFVVWMKLPEFDCKTINNFIKMTIDGLRVDDLLRRLSFSLEELQTILDITTKYNWWRELTDTFTKKSRRGSERLDHDGLRTCYRNGVLKGWIQGTNATSKQLRPNVNERVDQLMFSFTHFQLLADFCSAVHFTYLI